MPRHVFWPKDGGTKPRTAESLRDLSPLRVGTDHVRGDQRNLYKALASAKQQRRLNEGWVRSSGMKYSSAPLPERSLAGVGVLLS